MSNMDVLRAPIQALGMALFRAVRKVRPTGNALFSPLTASNGFLLIYLGSDGLTRVELIRALHIEHWCGSEQKQVDLEMAFRYILAALTKSRAARQQLSYDDPTDGRFRVFRINKIFLDETIVILPEYAERIAKLRSEAVLMPFSSRPEEARRLINRYFRDSMNGRVREAFPPEAITNQTQIVLANGFCFRARKVVEGEGKERVGRGAEVDSDGDDASSNSSWEDLGRPSDIAAKENVPVAQAEQPKTMKEILDGRCRAMRTFHPDQSMALVLVPWQPDECYTSVYELLEIPSSAIAPSVCHAFRKAARLYLGRKANTVEDYERYKLLTAAYNAWKEKGEARLQVKIPKNLFMSKEKSVRFHLVRDDLLEYEIRSHLSTRQDVLVVLSIPSDIAMKVCPAQFDGSRGTYPRRIALSEMFGLQVVEEGIRLAGEMDTTVEDALHLSFRRMDRQVLSTFVLFLVDSKASIDTLCELACSEAQELRSPYEMTIEGYVGVWLDVALKKGGPYHAMKLAERFEMAGVVLRIGYQFVLKEKANAYDTIGKQSAEFVTGRYRSSDKHYIALKEKRGVDGKYTCPFYWEARKEGSTVVRGCLGSTLMTRLEVENHIRREHRHQKDVLVQCGNCQMDYVLGENRESALMFKAKHDIQCRARCPRHMPNWEPSVKVSDRRRVARLPFKYELPKRITETVQGFWPERWERMYVEQPWVCYDANNVEKYLVDIMLRGQGVWGVKRHRWNE